VYVSRAKVGFPDAVNDMTVPLYEELKLEGGGQNSVMGELTICLEGNPFDNAISENL
jgi:hypothetical protein